MTSKSAAATDAARRIWERAAGNPGMAKHAAAEHLCTQLRTGLGRWIGAEGYLVLLDRARGLVRADHPTLGSLACFGGNEPATTAAVQTDGAGAMAAGMVALVAALIELLGRIIGEEMAVRLVEQSGMSSPRGVVSTETERGRDG